MIIICMFCRQVLGVVVVVVLLLVLVMVQVWCYDLVLMQVVDGVWMIEGLCEVFICQNGGVMVNVVLLQILVGVVVIDIGLIVVMGVEICVFVDQCMGGVVLVINIYYYFDYWFGNVVFGDSFSIVFVLIIVVCM